MIKRRTVLNIALTAAVCLAAPYIFVLINSYWALLMIPTIQILGLKAKLGVMLVIGLMNSLGSLLTAAIVCIPFGWIVRERASQYGGIVGATTSLFFLYSLFVFVPSPNEYWPPQTQLHAFNISMRVIESVSFIVGCMFFAHLGARLAQSKSA